MKMYCNFPFLANFDYSYFVPSYYTFTNRIPIALQKMGHLLSLGTDLSGGTLGVVEGMRRPSPREGRHCWVSARLRPVVLGSSPDSTPHSRL